VVIAALYLGTGHHEKELVRGLWADVVAAEYKREALLFLSDRDLCAHTSGVAAARGM
jgi:hypothetical protein